MTAKKDDFHVVVIGAGSVGLLIAQRLKTLGVKCTVYERETYLNERPRDWSFGIYWAQEAFNQCLPADLKDRLGTAHVDPSRKPSKDAVLPLCDGQTGETLMKVPTPFVYRLGRAKFRSLISEGVNIEYGKRLRAISNVADGKALAVFEDGSEAAGDLIVGADGAHSRVREYLLGTKKAALHSLPLVGCSVITTLPAAIVVKFRETINPISAIGYHPLGMIAFVALHEIKDENHPETWLWMLHLGWRSDTFQPLPSAEEAEREWKERSTKLAEPFRAMYTNVQGHLKYPCDRVAQWPTLAWDNHHGTVTLAGDAAHPMTYHRGQGLNNAAMDAANLCNAINDHLEKGLPIQEVLAAYEAEVVERGHQAVIESGENSLMLHDWEKLRQAQMFKSGVQRDKRD